MGPLAVGDDAPPVILNYLQWWSGPPPSRVTVSGTGRTHWADHSRLPHLYLSLLWDRFYVLLFSSTFLHPTLSFKYLCSTSLHRRRWWHLASLALFFLIQERRHYWLSQASLAGLLLGYWILQSTENTSLFGEKSRRPWVSKLYQLRAHGNNLLLLWQMFQINFSKCSHLLCCCHLLCPQLPLNIKYKCFSYRCSMVFILQSFCYWR